MPYPSTCLVDPSRVAKAQILYDPGKRNLTDLKSKVYVVCHQAKGMDSVSVTEHSFLYKLKEVLAVVVLKEYIRTAVTS
jgi:hypothetical protein